MNTISCPRCKARLPMSASFCRRCGQSILPTREAAQSARRLMLGNVAIILGGMVVAVWLILCVITPVQPWKKEPQPANDSVAAHQPAAMPPVDSVQPAPSPARREPH